MTSIHLKKLIALLLSAMFLQQEIPFWLPNSDILLCVYRRSLTITSIMGDPPSSPCHQTYVTTVDGPSFSSHTAMYSWWTWCYSTFTRTRAVQYRCCRRKHSCALQLRSITVKLFSAGASRKTKISKIFFEHNWTTCNMNSCNGNLEKDLLSS